MAEQKILQNGRRGILVVSAISYFIVLGFIGTYYIFKWLSSPWDWIAALFWLTWVLPQPVGYYLFGNGRQMDAHYIETGNYDPSQWESDL